MIGLIFLAGDLSFNSKMLLYCAGCLGRLINKENKFILTASEVWGNGWTLVFVGSLERRLDVDKMQPERVVTFLVHLAPALLLIHMIPLTARLTSFSFQRLTLLSVCYSLQSLFHPFVTTHLQGLDHQSLLVAKDVPLHLHRMIYMRHKQAQVKSHECLEQHFGLVNGRGVAKQYTNYQRASK